jgi:hypothetical protein
MRIAIPPLPQYAFLVWCSVKAQGQLYLLTLLSGEPSVEGHYRPTVRVAMSCTTPYKLHNVTSQGMSNVFVTQDRVMRS